MALATYGAIDEISRTKRRDIDRAAPRPALMQSDLEFMQKMVGYLALLSEKTSIEILLNSN